LLIIITRKTGTRWAQVIGWVLLAIASTGQVGLATVGYFSTLKYTTFGALAGDYFEHGIWATFGLIAVDLLAVHMILPSGLFGRKKRLVLPEAVHLGPAVYVGAGASRNEKASAIAEATNAKEHGGHEHGHAGHGHGHHDERGFVEKLLKEGAMWLLFFILIAPVVSMVVYYTMVRFNLGLHWLK